MNSSIKKLADIAEKPSRKIIGLMSGTSLDGLDIALCEISGSGHATRVALREFMTQPYGEEQQNKLKDISSVDRVSLKDICYIHTWLAHNHAELILSALEEWGVAPEEVDCIASHGQSIWHYPARDQPAGGSERLNTTLQITDGDHLARKTGILTISDFRQKHTAWGGEGAPMAALVDRILFGHETEPRILLNIGGIANFTWIPPGKNGGETSFTTDTGPGNTLIDSVAMQYTSKPFDEDGRIAASGTINDSLLEALLSDPWFDTGASKSTGPELFNAGWIKKRAEEENVNLSQVSIPDLLATVTRLSSVTIADSIGQHCPQSGSGKIKIYASGGGVHNPVLMAGIRELLKDFTVTDFSELGFDPDAKEALIFAVLANEMLAGQGFDFETESGRARKINFGKISFPV